MRAADFVDVIDDGFFTGVPDSLLRPFCDCLMRRFGVGGVHLIGPNEGSCIALAAGYYMAAGRVPVVYMQNSGIGNAVNPLLSLVSDDVYGVPCILVIGWRGEPGVLDEPQHVHQGRATLPLLDCLGVDTFVVDANTTVNDVSTQMKAWQPLLSNGRQVAFVVRKGAFEGDRCLYSNEFSLTREESLRRIIAASGKDKVVCTTGKASRELFELREEMAQGHNLDFLTVGSMGHASSIALGYALHQPNSRVWCIDGDGAALMHMGAMGLIGKLKPPNLVHVILDNGAHESVGGLPTAIGNEGFAVIARGCGYQHIVQAYDSMSLDCALEGIRVCKGLCFLEVKVAIGARSDLGRPTTSPKENIRAFMR